MGIEVHRFEGIPRVSDEYLEPPEITESRLWNIRNVFAAFLIGVVGAIIVFVAVPFYQLSVRNSMLLAAIVLVVYAIILFFMLEPGILREVSRTKVRVIDRPIVRDVVEYVEIPVIQKAVTPVIVSAPTPKVEKEKIVKKKIVRKRKGSKRSKRGFETVETVRVVKTVKKKIVRKKAAKKRKTS